MTVSMYRVEGPSAERSVASRAVRRGKPGIRSRCASCARERGGGDHGFTVVELMVVVLIVAILLAIVTPTFKGTGVGQADEQAQADLIAAMAVVKQVFAQTGSYDDINNSQLGCTTSDSVGGSCADSQNSVKSCGSGLVTAAEWSAYGLNWYNSGNTGPATPTNGTPDPNGSASDGNGCGDYYSGVVAVLSWSNGNNDTATTLAVAAGSPGSTTNDCWFVTLHSNGPDVYGFFKSNSTWYGCTALTTCWPDSTAPYTSSVGNTWYLACTTSAPTVTSPLPTTGFPADTDI